MKRPWKVCVAVDKREGVTFENEFRIRSFASLRSAEDAAIESVTPSTEGSFVLARVWGQIYEGWPTGECIEYRWTQVNGVATRRLRFGLPVVDSSTV